MNTTLEALLAVYMPSKMGMHGTANTYTTAEYYEAQFSLWQSCHVDWLKLVAASDSQVETCQRLGAQTDIIPVVRLYDQSCPANVIAPDLLAKYIDVGVSIFESPFNEFYADYENSWHTNLPSPSIPDWPQQVAHGWALFAEAVLSVGGVPTTPAIESWRYDTIFVPLFDVLCAQYADLLKQSIVAMHNRTLNHPVTYDKDSGGYLGWTWMDDYITLRLGETVPLLATEAGPEPGWDQDSTYPKVTPELHAEMVRDIITYPTPAHYLGDCFWLWHDDGTFRDASWHINYQYAANGDLPAVAMVQDMEIEPIEPVEWTIDEAPDKIREWCWNNIYPAGGIDYNPDAAFQQQTVYAPCTVEMHESGWAAQGFANGIFYCREGDWSGIGKLAWRS